MNGQKPLDLEVWLTEQQIAAEFETALANRFLDEMFFYWLPSSVRAWVDLTTSSEYRNSNRALQVLRSNADQLAKSWAGVGSMCSLGCGEGSKDRIILESFARIAKPLAYVAVDFSQSLLEFALTGSLEISRSRRGLKLDIFSDAHLHALMQSGPPCIFAVLGNTLGAFDPKRFPQRLLAIMRAEDHVLFDGEVFAGDSTLQGYDNPTNRRFAFAPLAGLGLTDGEDGELKFESREGKAGIHEVLKYFVARRDLNVHFGGKVLEFKSGEQVKMSSSIKYDESVFYSLIEQAGFEIEFRASSEDEHFLLAGAKPSSNRLHRR
jgi:uncharacterized SAM-dependent methyltransferase